VRNCLTYALGQWWRRGGYLVVRRSLAWEFFNISARPWWSPARLVWLVPHFLHKDYDGRITQYVPTVAQIERHSENLLRFWWGLWHFDGQVVDGDAGCSAIRARADRQLREQGKLS
jgi:hypothetical protein